MTGAEDLRLELDPEVDMGMEAPDGMGEMEFAPDAGETIDLTGEGASYFSGETMDEGMVEELGAEIVGIQSEAELDHFFGKMISGISKYAKAPAGRALQGLLKRVAKKALGTAGGAIGSYFGGPVGNMIGSTLSSSAGQMLGLETEGLSPQDEQFAVGKALVNLATAAARKLDSTAPSAGSPQASARQALAQAARRHAPGLLAGASRSRGGARRGSWVRHGRRIILYGV